MSRFDDAIARIDAANAQDPNTVMVDGAARPAELVYGERMSGRLARFAPDASDALRLAARGQHLMRWKVPRASYPMDRPGYHRWRGDLKRRHATWMAEILTACGYEPDDAARVASLVRKDNLSTDAESQTLEDVACLVFLEHYAADFASRHETSKTVEILRKTWRKMSADGQAAALSLALDPSVRTLVEKALQPEQEVDA